MTEVFTPHFDDFLVLGPPGKTCAEHLSATLELCQELGFLVMEETTEGPTTVITFLGIKIDTQKQQVCLPKEKLARLTTTIGGWMSRIEYPSARSSARKRDLPPGPSSPRGNSGPTWESICP